MCEICKDKNVFTKCPGCGVSLCQNCSCLELIGSGCGCVWPVYYCIKCSLDAAINPNAIFKIPDR